MRIRRIEDRRTGICTSRRASSHSSSKSTYAPMVSGYVPSKAQTIISSRRRKLWIRCFQSSVLSPNIFLLRKTRLKSHLGRFWMQHRRVLHVPFCRPCPLPKLFLRLLRTEALKSKMFSVRSLVVGCGTERTWARIDAEP